MEGFNIIVVTIMGLIFGSFLGMLVYRLPLGISLLNPKRSLCPQCNHSLTWYENIPVFSYLFLQGKCSKCHNKISIFYLSIELTTTLVTLLLFLKIGLNYQFCILLLLCYCLIVLSFIDLRYKAVPDYLLVLSLLVAIIYTLLYKNENIMSLFVFAGGIVILELFVTFYIQNIKSKLVNDKSLEDQRALGEGDIPIVAIIGGILGLHLGLSALFLSAILAIIPSLINIIMKKESQTPFIPFLTMGFLIVLLDGFDIINIINAVYPK